MALTLVSFFVIIIVLILAHELGHFITAKASRVKVEEFGIFLPPSIFKVKIGETVYSLNAIPFGGFNKLSGEEDPRATGSLAGKSIPIRMLVLGAGSLMNLLLPIVLLTIALMLPHQVEVADPEYGQGNVLVQSVEVDSPAAQAGIKAGDIIVSVNGMAVSNVNGYRTQVQANLGNQITVIVRHAGNGQATLFLTPRTEIAPGQGATGVSLTTVVTESASLREAFPGSFVRYWQILVTFVAGIVQSIRGTIPFEVTGPVGIAQVVGEVARTGMANLLQLAAIISINLGIVNFFPIPGLDGGRIVFVLLEWVRGGKRVSHQTENLIHTIGFILLFALIIFATYRDILRLISGQSPLG
jgi:regulator of sigma E protease